MIDEEKRLAVFEKNSGECGHCEKTLAFDNRLRAGRGAWEVEHLHPRARGGTDHLNNLVAACWTCNLDKGTRSARSHRRAVAPVRAARVSRRRWRVAGKALIPAAIVGGLAYLWLKKNKTPSEAELQYLPEQEQNRIWWRNLLIPVAAGLATMLLVVLISEAFRKA
ncbi:MAG: HNH endonuclease [Elusimicrobiota bacterium]